MLCLGGLGLALAFCSLLPGDGKSPQVGDAWTDPQNPVAVRFHGKRLDLWSLKPPVRTAPPSSEDRSWARTPVDDFILAKLLAAGLRPSAEADRRTLIRRLSFDLLGLPPSPEEVQAFLDDQRPDAYERLVDRLLASPHYGEQWGRHWLDVVRYSDSNGFERDEFRPSAWRYRDYVVRAFNRDLPYDQFLREQLAGDELAGDRAGEEAEWQRVATGFLRVGPWDTTKFTNLDSPELARDELLVDLTNTTASGFLGLTFNCCRCHDHKYDPFVQADYYRLRAFFAAIQFHEYPLPDSPHARADAARRRIELDRELAPALHDLWAFEGRARALAMAKRTKWIDRLERVEALLGRSHAGLGREQLLTAVRQALAQLREVRESEFLAELPNKEREHHEALKGRVGQFRALQGMWTALGVNEDPKKVPPTRVLRQGDWRKPKEEVQPGVPSLFTPAAMQVGAKPQAKTTGRRNALADWITSRQNPWTARVLVNRLWQHHFGKGLVATPDDFGHSGARPTHPELLDWLAVELMDSGWSIKHVQRLILTSAVYRQASAIDPAKKPLDPDNRLLWRQNVQRLDAETLRDALLRVSGSLRPTAAGPPRWPEVPKDLLLSLPNIFEDTDRPQGYYPDPAEKADVRSVFLVRKRGVPTPFLQAFNQPDPACTCGRRDVSIVAPQALTLLNNDFAVRMARGLADRLFRECGCDPRRQAERALWLAFGRPPSDGEVDIILQELDRLRGIHAPRLGNGAARAALADVCLALLNANEFLFVD